jgi:hypothetical protein
MPIPSPTVLTSQRRYIRRGAAIAAACIVAVALAFADEFSSPARTITEPNVQATSRYYDIEANKAATMRTAGRRNTEQQTNRTSRNHDRHAHKSTQQRGR